MSTCKGDDGCGFLIGMWPVGLLGLSMFVLTCIYLPWKEGKEREATRQMELAEFERTKRRAELGNERMRRLLEKKEKHLRETGTRYGFTSKTIREKIAVDEADGYIASTGGGSMRGMSMFGFGGMSGSFSSQMNGEYHAGKRYYLLTTDGFTVEVDMTTYHSVSVGAQFTARDERWERQE